MLSLFLAIIVGYGIGTLSFGIIACKIFNLGDIQQIGSGNIGATNILRTGNKIAAFFTLVGDSGKGLFYLLALKYISDDTMMLLCGGIAAILGHNFPFWLKFKGGKGVATSIGVIFIWSWQLGIIYCLSWLMIAIITRISSLSALSAFTITTIISYFITDIIMIVIAILFITILAFIRHYSNIKRIINGTEQRINLKKT